MGPSNIVYDVAAILSLLSALICGLAVISCYIFPQQRKFPNVVLVWTCVGDFVFTLYISILWLPGPAKQLYLAQMFKSDTLCAFALYALLALEESALVLGFLLACTLYLNVVKHVDMDQNKAYYYGFLAAFWIPTTLFPCITFFERGHSIVLGYCTLKSKVGIAIRILNWIVMILLQVILLIKVFYTVNTVTNAVHRHSSNRYDSSAAYFWLCARCFGAMITQVVVWLPATASQVYEITGRVPDHYLMLICVTTPSFVSLNGLIVLAGNKPLRNSLCALFTRYFRPKESKMSRVGSFAQSNELNYF
eukprot:Phypoly_transcript_09263.p1 GENE.Phypoly_transcript_09263~~Phypoly_transcript_09263.p1  ORF type:complete len:306 (+),score=1.07 Phypoly_transcript_09263:250-1167(+)